MMMKIKGLMVLGDKPLHLYHPCTEVTHDAWKNNSGLEEYLFYLKQRL